MSHLPIVKMIACHYVEIHGHDKVHYIRFYADFEDANFEESADGQDFRPDLRRPNSRHTFPDLVAKGIIDFIHNCDKINPKYVLNGPTITLLWHSLLREKYSEWETEFSQGRKMKILCNAEKQNDYQFPELCPKDKKHYGQRLANYWQAKKEKYQIWDLDTSSGDLVAETDFSDLTDADGLQYMAKDGTSVEEQIALWARADVGISFSLNTILRIRDEDRDEGVYRDKIRAKYRSETDQDLTDDDFEEYRKSSGLPEFKPSGTPFYEVEGEENEGELWLAERLNMSELAATWAERMLAKHGKDPAYFVEDSSDEDRDEDEEGLANQAAMTRRRDEDLTDLDNDAAVLDALSEEWKEKLRTDELRPKGAKETFFTGLAHRPLKKSVVPNESEKFTGLALRPLKRKAIKEEAEDDDDEGMLSGSGEMGEDSMELAVEPIKRNRIRKRGKGKRVKDE